jgi:NitT/TauT family transport system permease protein
MSLTRTTPPRPTTALPPWPRWYTPPPPHRHRNPWRRLAGAVLPPIALGAVILGAWYAISYGLLEERRRFLLRPPHQVVQKGFLDWDTFSEILARSVVEHPGGAHRAGDRHRAGHVLAIIMSQAKMAERAIFPYMVTLQAIPILAIVPLISFWFGTGQTSRVVVCVIIALFPIIVNTLFGLQSAERGAHDLFTLHHANRVTRLRKLMFPAAMPAIFAGLRISAGLVGHRGRRGRLLLRTRRCRHRQPAPPLRQQAPGRGAARRGHHDVGTGRDRLRDLRHDPDRAIGKWHDGSSGL